MSMQDPVSNMLTCIRNSQLSKKDNVLIYYSKFKESILKIFWKEGFIKNYSLINNNFKKYILIKLKYFTGLPVISKLKRISRPGLRVYLPFNKLPIIKSGLGILIISTSKGVLSDKEARLYKIGGEIICYIF